MADTRTRAETSNDTSVMQSSNSMADSRTRTESSNNTLSRIQINNNNNLFIIQYCLIIIITWITTMLSDGT